jgi:hypothetical protein
LAGGAPELAAPGAALAPPQQPVSPGVALSAPAAGRAPRAARARVPRDEDADDEYYEEDFYPGTSHLEQAPSGPTAPAKSVPLQPLLEKLDKLLKEPAPPAEEPRPRRGGKVELPANPY